MFERRLDYSLLKRQVLRVLRGSLTQTELSQRLGYSYNQTGKWETEAKRMKWQDFYDCCEAVGISLDKPLRDVFLLEGDLRNSANILKGLRIFSSLLTRTELAEKLNSHPSVIARWISGAVAPDIEFIFMLMDLRVNLLAAFIKQIVDIDKIESIRAHYYFVEKMVRQDFSDPTLLSVWLAVRLKGYQDLSAHSDDFLAEVTGLPVVQTKANLQQLVLMNQICFTSGKYEVCGDLPIKNLHGDQAAVGRMRSYWAERSLTRFEDKTGIARNDFKRPNLQTFLVQTVSKATMQKISDRLHAAFEEVIQIANNDDGPEEEIRVILIDVFAPGDAPLPDHASDRSIGQRINLPIISP